MILPTILPTSRLAPCVRTLSISPGRILTSTRSMPPMSRKLDAEGSASRIVGRRSGWPPRRGRLSPLWETTYRALGRPSSALTLSTSPRRIGTPNRSMPPMSRKLDAEGSASRIVGRRSGWPPRRGRLSPLRETTYRALGRPSSALTLSTSPGRLGTSKRSMPPMSRKLDAEGSASRIVGLRSG